jgi:tetratricopeptide (TPR) repeat protein
LGVGVWGVWSLGSRAYSSGYYTYDNPYYVESAVIAENPALDYSQPLELSTTETEEPPAATEQFDAARTSFYDGNYGTAQQQVESALRDMPYDSVLHEFRALVLFATGDYRPAAAGIHSVLAVGPGWDWTTMISLYPNVEVYTQQLRKLEEYRKQNPKAADAHFLLAYHYLTAGHADAAAKELEKVVSLSPGDHLAQQMLDSFREGESAETEGSEQPAAEPKSNRPDESSGRSYDLDGTWSADRDAKTKVVLTLSPDETFQWKTSTSQGDQEFDGTYTYGNGLLTLTDEGNMDMVGRVTWTDQGHYTFTLVNGPPGDGGLSFSR